MKSVKTLEAIVQKFLDMNQPAATVIRQHLEEPLEPIPMLLACPSCGSRHIDEGEFACAPAGGLIKIHHTHACQHCGMVWRPAIVPTVGVQFLPGFGPSK